MPPISWILFRERVVARNSPKFLDVDNRSLRQIVELHGWDPDDPNFTGLHHFPNGAFTDHIAEETLTAGVSIDSDVYLTGGKFTFTANDDFDIHLVTNPLNIDGGDVHLTNGVFFGDIDTGRIVTRLSVTRAVITGDLAYTGAGTFAELYVGLEGKLTVFSNFPSDINELHLGAAVSADPIFVRTVHKIGGVPWAAGGAVVDSLVDYLPTERRWVHTSSGSTSAVFKSVNAAWEWFDTVGFHSSSGVHFIVPFDGIYMWANGAENDFTTVEKIIDFGETGWSLGSGGSQKGGLIAGTSTLTTTQQVVNSLVSALMSHHKLLRA